MALINQSLCFSLIQSIDCFIDGGVGLDLFFEGKKIIGPGCLREGSEKEFAGESKENKVANVLGDKLLRLLYRQNDEPDTKINHQAQKLVWVETKVLAQKRIEWGRQKEKIAPQIIVDPEPIEVQTQVPQTYQHHQGSKAPHLQRPK